MEMLTNSLNRVRRLGIAGLVLALPAMWAASEPPPPTLEIEDYAAMPITGLPDGKGQTDGMLARVNSLREEAGDANRFFVNDLNGHLAPCILCVLGVNALLYP